GNVLNPRNKSQASNGDKTAPKPFLVVSAISVMISSLPTATPAMTSPCPFKYLVALCTTMSQPKSIGRCKYGDENVLSTTTGILCSFATFATNCKSIKVI